MSAQAMSEAGKPALAAALLQGTVDLPHNLTQDAAFQEIDVETLLDVV